MPRKVANGKVSSAPPPADPVNVLAEVVKRLARQMELAVVEQPSELYQNVTRSHQMADELGIEIKLKPQISSSFVIGLLIDHYALLISAVGSSPRSDDVVARLSACHRQAAIALTWLNTQCKNDLNLFLVGPLGSASDPRWHDLASRVERDELICRKLVWLPPEDSEDLHKSAQSFCARTFLAQPWNSGGTAGTPELDPMARISEGDAVLRHWLSVLESAEDPGTSLVDRLITAWRLHNQEAGNVPQPG